MGATENGKRMSPQDRVAAALERSGTAFSELLDALVECNQSLMRLVQLRVNRSWTDFEYEAYLRLRTTKTDLDARAQQAQHRFERARLSVRSPTNKSQARQETVA